MSRDEVAYPLDIKKNWLSVARRMQSVSRTDGFALVSITVLVDQDGVPRFWTEPKCLKIEPKKSVSEILEIMRKFAEGERVIDG